MTCEDERYGTTAKQCTIIKNTKKKKQTYEMKCMR